MAIYGGARLVMLAWLLCGVLWLSGCCTARRKHRLRVLLGVALRCRLVVADFVADALSSGFDAAHDLFLRWISPMRHQSQFLRFQIWAGHFSIISENVWLGLVR